MIIFHSQFDHGVDNAENITRGEPDSRTVNQEYLSSNSAESSTGRICPRMPDVCVRSPFIHPPQLAARSWRVRKANLFPLAEGGACILKRRCLQQQAIVVAALSPLTLSPSLSFSSPFASRPSDSPRNRTRSGDYFSFARFYLL